MGPLHFLGGLVMGQNGVSYNHLTEAEWIQDVNYDDWFGYRKISFSPFCSDRRFVNKKALKRKQVLGYMGKLEPCLIAMEACGGAHYWAREFVALGHDVKLIAPHYVRPYVKGNKNDYNDAEGIAEAAQRPTMRLCP